jgi:hypothetical protein
MSGKFTNYFVTNQFFNIMGLTSYLLFYIGLILRFTDTYNEEAFFAPKIILAYDLELWYMRSLMFLGIAKHMGPKLVMIRKMVCIIFHFNIYIIYVYLDNRFIFLYIYYSNCNDCIWCCITNNV